MNIADLHAQIEEEKAWRQDEIRFFQNRGASLVRADEQDQYRRALVLVLYAHFEGFAKFTFDLYRNAVNSEQIQCDAANHAIAAAALASVFKGLREPNTKCAEFKRELPDDSKLHRFARDREFVERSSEFGQRKVEIPEHVVDTESNLTPIVLRKNLFRLGFSHTQFQEHEGEINKLLSYRNSIAHGETRRGVPLDVYEDLRRIVFAVMDAIGQHVMRSLRDRQFLKANVPAAPAASQMQAAQ